jgi:hypothetical protein
LTRGLDVSLIDAKGVGNPGRFAKPFGLTSSLSEIHAAKKMPDSCSHQHGLPLSGKEADQRARNRDSPAMIRDALDERDRIGWQAPGGCTELNTGFGPGQK